MEITPLDQKSEAHRRRLMIAGAAGLGEADDVSEATPATAVATDMNGSSSDYGAPGMPAALRSESDNAQSMK